VKERQATAYQRCAIYTRKSTEAGLERELNSLEAQRETCSAYIRSQRHRGWLELPQHYDDGGFSGANLQRPGLQQLLADIEAARIDVVVIYKIDRLTRSLLDFVRLLDTMQRYGVSFVSITQAFDTGDSMGRLILNVLLTFAQFERELIGDRLRDKFAMMKRRGKWVGGREPFGYRKQAGRLIVEPAVAAIVRSIYERYPLYPSGNQLLRALQCEGIRNKTRVAANGKVEGGRLFAEGMFHRLLTNPIYLGKIEYQGELFEGEHEPIITQGQWDGVQALRKQRHDLQIPRQPIGNLLLGILHDTHGRRMDVDTVVKNGRRFRYYSTRVDRSPRQARLKIVRVDGDEVEQVTTGALRTFLCDRPAVGEALSTLGLYDEEVDRAAAAGSETAAKLARLTTGATRLVCVAVLRRAEVSRDRLRLFICCHELHRLLLWDGIGHFRADGIERARIKARVHVLDVPVGLVRENNATYLPLSPRDESQARDPNPHLVGLLDKGRRALDDVFANREVAVADLARRRGVSPHRYARLVKLNYLAPDIVAAILDGQQPPDLTVHKLIRTSVPLDWAVQRQMLGFGPRHDVGGSLTRHHDWRRWDPAYGHGSMQAGPNKPLCPSDEAADEDGDGIS